MGTRHALQAINPDGTLKWEYQESYGQFFSPVIGSDGTIFVGKDVGKKENRIYAIGD